MKKNTSFTLIELLVVIVIIGVIAGVIIVTTTSSIGKANITKLKVFEESVANNLAANMVSRWKLDEITGTAAPYTTSDQWGSNTGTLYFDSLTAGYGDSHTSGPMSEANCISGTCFKFDGVDDYMNCGNGASLSMGKDDQTISMWVKMDNPLLAQNQTFISNGAGNTGTGLDGIWLYSVSSSSSIQLYFTDGVKSRVGGIIATISDSNWHHFNVILDRDTYATSYLDGVQTKLTFDITGQQGDIQNSRSTLIGAYSSSMDLFKGIIDDVRIYNAVLSSSQIKQNYIAGLNSLLSNGNISKEEYNQRINSLSEK